MSESDEGAIRSATRQKDGRVAEARAAAVPPPGGTKVPAGTNCASDTVVPGSERDRDRRSHAAADTPGLSACPAAPNKRAQTRAGTGGISHGNPWANPVCSPG